MLKLSKLCHKTQTVYVLHKKLHVSLQFSDQDASQGWPRAVVSREQHAQDDPHTGNGQEKLPASARSTYISMRVCKKNPWFCSLSIVTVFSALIKQGWMDMKAGQGSW